MPNASRQKKYCATIDIICGGEIITSVEAEADAGSFFKAIVQAGNFVIEVNEAIEGLLPKARTIPKIMDLIEQIGPNHKSTPKKCATSPEPTEEPTEI